MAGTLHLLAATVACSLGAFGGSYLRAAFAGSTATAAIVAAAILLLLALLEFQRAGWFYARRAEAEFDDGGVPLGVLVVLVPSAGILWHSSAVGSSVDELLVWVLGLVGLFVLVVFASIAAIVSIGAVWGEHGHVATFVNRALLVGVAGIVLLFVTSEILQYQSRNEDSTPRCDGRLMKPGDSCIQMSGFGSGGSSEVGTYEERKQRGEQDSRHLREGAALGFAAARVLLFVVILSAGATGLARLVRSWSQRSKPRAR
jgi:hypothetical protein